MKTVEETNGKHTYLLILSYVTQIQLNDTYTSCIGYDVQFDTQATNV